MQIPKFLNFLNKNGEVHESQQKLPFSETLGIMPQSEEDDEPEKITSSTKIKVIAAFLIVGLAAYIAYWVQEPTEYKAQLLTETEEVMMAEAAPAEEAIPAMETTSAPSEQVVAAVEKPVMTADSESAAPLETMTQAQQDLSTQEVSIIDFNFDPPEINVPVGGTLVWTNKDAVPHTVSGIDFTSGTLNPGESFTYTFSDEGTFDYSSALHPQMKGKIVVGSGVSTMFNTQTQEIQPVKPVAADIAATVDPETPLGQEPELTGNFYMGGDDFSTPLITSADIQQAHAAAEESAASLAETKDLAKSGPEDMLYVLAFGIILFLNRKKILYRSR